MAAKFFTGLPLDGPDPECVLGHGERRRRWSAQVGAEPRRWPLQASLRPGAGRAEVRVTLGAAAVTRLVEPVRLRGGSPDPPRVRPARDQPREAPGALRARMSPTTGRRAAGGRGVIVVEEASVHDSDWPYERAPLAADAAEGWSRSPSPARTRVRWCIAALGHAGGQGSSAYRPALLLGRLRGARRGDAGSPQGDGGRGRREPGRRLPRRGWRRRRGRMRRRRAERRPVQPAPTVLLRPDQPPQRRARRLPAELVRRVIRPRGRPSTVVGHRCNRRPEAVAADELAPWAGIGAGGRRRARRDVSRPWDSTTSASCGAPRTRDLCHPPGRSCRAGLQPRHCSSRPPRPPGRGRAGRSGLDRRCRARRGPR